MFTLNGKLIIKLSTSVKLCIITSHVFEGTEGAQYAASHSSGTGASFEQLTH